MADPSYTGPSKPPNFFGETNSVNLPPTALPASWTFDHAGSSSAESSRRSNIPRPSIFNSTSPSRYGPSPSASTYFPISSPTLGARDEPGRNPHQSPSVALEGTSLPEAWRSDQMEDGVRATVHRRRIPRVEKDADDPSSTSDPNRNSLNRQQSTTLTTLSRLFAVHAATSPNDSRSGSYNHHVADYTTAAPAQAPPPSSLPEHLYTRGLLGGRHSDITVHAFGFPYKLHRLLLDRSPFFASALSGPWLESNAKEMTLHPEEIDSNITQSSFELALKRLYGAATAGEEDTEAIGLFATACWLEMPELINSSIEAMHRQMTIDRLASLIRLVTNNYYGRAGDKILASAKAMLCRDGWKMPLRYWDGIPGDIIREITGGDGFFIDGEWDRWVLAKRLLDRRLRKLAVQAGLVEPGSRDKVLRAPDTANLMAVRFDTVYRKNSMTTLGGTSDHLHRWIMLYTNPEVEPLLVLMDEGIHYVHLNFEQLQYIRRARDVLGLPVMPEKVISNALWQQMELRQTVVNARDTDMELGISSVAEDRQSLSRMSRDTTTAIASPTSSTKGKAKARIQPSSLDEVAEDDIPSNSWDGNGKPRKFWIPSADCNIVMGGNADPVIATSGGSASRLSATIQPEDVQWASDFAANTSDTRPLGSISRPGSAASDMRPIAYSHFPPFRFAVEFPNPRVLKEKKRVYSQTVFYAGSWFNVYVQKVRRGKNPQLGVYLHRAKEREPEDAAGGNSGMTQSSVDERIGHLEREMLMRADMRSAERRRLLARRRSGEAEVDADGGDSSGSADPDATLNAADPSSRSAVRSLLGNNAACRKSSENDILDGSPPDSHTLGNMRHLRQVDEDDQDEDPEIARLSRSVRIPTLPPYVDTRPTIRTYFKIYSPSKGGRMLSVYESAPDTFNFSQSWGWKSSTLMLDEGLLAEDGTEEADASMGGNIRKDGKLRFMIVIGNV